MIQFFTRDLVWVEVRCHWTPSGHFLETDRLVLDAFKQWMSDQKIVPVRNPVSDKHFWVGAFEPSDGSKVVQELLRLGAEHVVL